MNLTDMEDADAKRLVDFSAGLIFGLHGSIERVTAKVFLLSPANVVVTAEEKARLAEGGFFNQSLDRRAATGDPAWVTWLRLLRWPRRSSATSSARSPGSSWSS